MQVFKLAIEIEKETGRSLPISRVNSMIKALELYDEQFCSNEPLSSEQLVFAEALRPVADLVLRTHTSVNEQAFLTFAGKVHTLYYAPLKEVTPGMGLQAWLHSDRVGLSSAYLAHITVGAPLAPYAEPADFDDIRRCIKFLIAVPTAKDNLYKISGKSPKWSFIVAHLPLLLEFVGLELENAPIPDELDVRTDHFLDAFMSLE